MDEITSQKLIVGLKAAVVWYRFGQFVEKQRTRATIEVQLLFPKLLSLVV